MNLLKLANIPAPPKPRNDNLEWRGDWAQRAFNDEDLQCELLARCKNDIAFWFDGYAWTNNPHDRGPTRHIPFILWDCQTRYVEWLRQQIEEGRDHLSDKSRFMGATWMHCGTYLHGFLFDANALYLVGTLTKQKLEGDSDDALFPKIDYMIERLHSWMLPTGWVNKHPCRQPYLYKNPYTGAEILGEACGRHWGRSGRRTSGWIDEGGEIMKLADSLSACSATVKGLSITGTPKGRGGKFAQLRFDGTYNVYEDSEVTKARIENRPADQFPVWRKPGLHWTLSPSHTEGLYFCKPGCRIEHHKKGGFPHSPWYDQVCRRLNYDSREIAQQLDLDYTAAGGCIFNTATIETVIEFIRANEAAGNLKFQHYELQWEQPGHGTTAEEVHRSHDKHKVIATPCNHGPLRVLKPPIPGHVYCFGGDISDNSVGGTESDGAIYDATAGYTVAEWHGKMDPDELANEWAKLCRWYSPNMNWADSCYATVERNGPGKSVVKIMDQCGILMHCHINEGKDTQHRQDGRIGIILSRHNREELIYENLLPLVNNTGEDGLPLLRDPFVEFWLQCETFVVRAIPQPDMKPVTTRIGAQKDCFDDRVFARHHMIYGVIIRFNGQLRDNLPG